MNDLPTQFEATSDMEANMTTNTAPGSKPTITFTASVHVNAAQDVTFGVLADPHTHMQWAGTQAPNASFKLLSLDTPAEPMKTGMVFTSTGANGTGMTFHDRSTVVVFKPPAAFGFSTESELQRKHRPTWRARFEHRYTVSADASGSRIDYRAEVYPLNYRPYWLHPLMRPMTGILVPRMMTKNLQQLAGMAERAASGTDMARKR
jgi:hypothetical protein